MQNLILFIFLFSSTVLLAQNSSLQEGRVARTAQPFYQELLHDLQSAPPGVQDYLCRWLNLPQERTPRREPITRRTPRSRSKRWPGKFNESRLHTLAGEVHEAWVRHYASALAPGLDEVTAMTVDDAGNVYVTGYGANLPFQPDYLTIKYDPAGNQVWKAQFNGGSDGADLALAIQVDSAGNVYATGSSASEGVTSDYATIKYNAAGVEQWIVRYNGAGNADDEAVDLAVDNAGNVYVTGRSTGSAFDYATIKYNASGVEQWVARYNGWGNADDAAADLAVDDAGNVYVTGTSVGSSTNEDYVTIKYDAGGAEHWVARYNGPGDRNHDEAAALAIDRAGNVFVSGTSEGLGTIEAYATIKYNVAGEQQWVARYNGPGDYDVATAIALDNLGNVYVTGLSDSAAFNSDYATVKYDAAGMQQWVARYNGPGNDLDDATALAVDVAGNIYVTGMSFGSGTERDYATIKYNAAGVRQWVVRYNDSNNDDVAAALAVDADGNVYVAGTSDGIDTFADYATFKYNSAGAEQWSRRCNSLGNADDRAIAAALDPAGNLYITGRSRRLDTGFDYLTIKFDPSGITQWMARYTGPGNGADEPAAIAVDEAGNVYVTGRSAGSGSADDYATVKYNSAGSELWVRRYNGSGNAEDDAVALAIDPASRGDNVYVTGWSTGTGSRRDYATISYNSAGAERWVARYDEAGNDDQAIALRIDADGNIYVTGKSTGSDGSWDYATIKYNNAGERQWVARYLGSGNADDEATALAIDGLGNVYVTGSSIGASTFADYATIKYNFSGAEQWVRRYDDPERPFNMAAALAVDEDGNVVVMGTSWRPATSFDYTTVKYYASGEQQWVANYNGPESDADHATALVLDDSGNVYVTGWSVGAGSFSDYATIKYDPAGVQQWLARYNRFGASLDYAAALVVDSASEARNVYVTGWSEGKYWSTYTTIKYAQTPPVSVQDKRPAHPGSYWLSQNFPNPVGKRTSFLGTGGGNAFTRIRYSLPKAGHVTLKVFNLLGEEIATLVSDQKPAGEHEAQWNPRDLPGGVYLCRLQVGGSAAGSKHDYVDTKKLTLLP